MIVRSMDGKGYTLKSEEWFLGIELHRLNKPAYISYDEEGNIEQESWSQHGKPHRIDGPAQIFYDKKGIIHKSWAVDGVILHALEAIIKDPELIMRNAIDNRKVWPQLRLLCEFHGWITADQMNAIDCAFGLT